MPEDGLALLLTLQMIVSVVAAIAWWRSARDPTPQAMRFASYVAFA